MGWGIWVKCYLRKVSKEQVTATREEAEEAAERIRDSLLALAVAAPRDDRDENGDIRETWEDRCTREIPELLREYEEQTRIAFLCGQAEEDPDSVEGES